MHFKIRNYRAVKNADIELGVLTALYGKNDVGKTSTLDAVRSAATADGNPFGKEIPTKYSSMFVHSGTPSGFVEIKDEDNVARIDYPGCKYSSKGKPIKISRVAAGLDSLADMSNPNRLKYITDMMDAAPTQRELVNALIDAGVLGKGYKPQPQDTKEPDLFTRLWELVDLNGYDIAYSKVKEKGAVLKGRWEQLTGANYGKRIAEKWLPDSWAADLEKTEEAALIDELNSAKQWHEAAISSTAVEESEKKELQRIAGNVETIKSTLKVLEKSLAVTDREIVKKSEGRRKIEGATPSVIFECPSCKDRLIVKNNKLIKAENTATDKKSVEKELAKIDKELNALNKQRDTIIRQQGERKSELELAEQAVEKLKTPTPGGKISDEAGIADAANRLELAEDRLSAFRLHRDARLANDNINGNLKLQAILAPAGLRRTKLIDKFKMINNSMRALTDLVGWKTVEINDAGDILAGGVPFGRLIAKSDRYRVRVLLQLMCAMAEKSAFVIIDDADELTESLRSQLFRVVLESKKRAVIVSALNDKSNLKIPKIDGFRSYWVEDGEAKEATA